MLFVIVAVEGATLLQMHQLITVHVFVGMLLVPLVLLKLASTGYRFTRYYTGAPAYTRKGPPHPILRGDAPLVVLATLALLGTGITLIALGRNVGHQYLEYHKIAFFVWLAVMAVHVLGHLEDTITLSTADVLDRHRSDPAAPALPGAGLRLTGLVAAAAIGVALGAASISWVGTWGNFVHFGH